MIHTIHPSRAVGTACLACGELAEPEVHQTRSGFYCEKCCLYCRPAEPFTGEPAPTIMGEQESLF